MSVSGVIESFIDIRDTMSLKPIVDVLKKVSIPDYVQKMALDLNSQKQGTVQTPSQFKESLLQENWRQMPALFGSLGQGARSRELLWRWFLCGQ